VAAGLFGSQALGGLGGVTLGAQLIGTLMGVAWAAGGGLLVYGLLKMTMGIRLSQEEEYDGADLSIHKISASPEREANWYERLFPATKVESCSFALKTTR
jgi:Amt family ammonium transporter